MNIMSEKITISIIGSASGKNKYDHLLNEEKWHYMCQISENYIIEKIKHDWSQIILVSGGAAWSDHVAVFLYLKHPEANLILHLPCRWDHCNNRLIDNGKYQWTTNPGKLGNTLHYNFQKEIKENTLQQIQLAIDQGATIFDHYKGFHDRNLEVGKSQYLIAFSFSHRNEPTDGGTAHTWKNSKSENKIHFTLTK